MKKVLIGLLAGLLIAAPAAQAGTIGFEDLLPPSCCIYSIPGAYQGFQWLGGSGDNSWAVSNAAGNLFAGTQAHSGAAFAWSNGGTDLTLSGAPFALDSMWVRLADGTTPVTFKGYTGGVQTFGASFNVAAQYQQVELHFSGIDLLLINSNEQNLLIDDIVVNTNAVPEPATGATILLGLGLLGCMRRKASWPAG